MEVLYTGGMTVSVVVPTLNEEKLVGRFLNSLLYQKVRPIEVIVADGGSKDGTLEIVGSYQFKFKKLGVVVKVVVAHPGAVRLRDLGFRLAKGDLIASMDADTYYSPAYLKLALKQFKDGVVGVTGPSKLFDPPKFAVIEKRIQDWRDRLTFMIWKTCFYPRAYNLVFAKQAYLNTPGMQLDVPAVEDEMGLAKLLNSQGKIRYCSDLVPVTSARRYKRGLGYFLIKTVIYDYWWGYFRAKYLGRKLAYERVS